MFIKPIIPMESLIQQGIDKKSQIEYQPSTDFASIFKSAMSNVQQLQEVAQQGAEQLDMGQVDDIHSIMLQTEKATLALELTVQVTSKAVNAYNEIMRMQM